VDTSPRRPAACWKRADLRERLHRVRLDGTLAVQSGVAAGLAWFVAHNLLGHVEPFFAPISAVIVLSANVGQRWRRAAEMVFGVALGIGIGDALILLIGVGVVQIALVVTLAMVVAVFIGGSGLTVSQSASSAVLVATLAPPTTGIYTDRLVDALIGGLVGITVMALLLPLHPLTRVERAAGRSLEALAEALTATADALSGHEPEAAERALQRLRSRESDHAHLRETLDVGQETATLAPIRWHNKPALTRYVEAATHLERATRNVRMLTRPVAVLAAAPTPPPPELEVALRLLAEAVRTLREELAGDAEPTRARELARQAVRAADRAYERGLGFAATSVVAQIRGAATNLLCATGLDPTDAEAMVRAAGEAAGPG